MSRYFTGFVWTLVTLSLCLLLAYWIVVFPNLSRMSIPDRVLFYTVVVLFGLAYLTGLTGSFLASLGKFANESIVARAGVRMFVWALVAESLIVFALVALFWFSYFFSRR